MGGEYTTDDRKRLRLFCFFWSELAFHIGHGTICFDTLWSWKFGCRCHLNVKQMDTIPGSISQNLFCFCSIGQCMFLILPKRKPMREMLFAPQLVSNMFSMRVVYKFAGNLAYYTLSASRERTKRRFLSPNFEAENG